MRVLITGGAGFIGSNFLKSLISESSTFPVSEIRVLDKLTYSGSITNFKGIPSDSFEFIQGDINDLQVVESALNGVDLVFHFAAESHVDRSINSSRVFFETNVVGTQTLLQASLSKEVAKFIHVSTDEVYGSIKEGSWIEEFPLSPNSPYSASKASSDLVCLAYVKTYGMNISISRCTNNYGPNQFPEKVIPLFLTNLIEGKKVPLYGDGGNVRDWLHVSDHCHGLMLVAKHGKSGEIYNLGGGEELENIELTKIILEAFGLGYDWIDFVPDRKGHDFRYSVDISKAQRDLGYRPSMPFKSGISQTVSWYRENRDWWEPLKRK